MTHRAAAARVDAIDEYAELLVTYRPRSIRDEAEAARIQTQIDALIDKRGRTKAEDELLSLLGDIMFTWEGGNEPLPDLPPHEMAQALMELNDYKQIDLVGPVFPTQSIASEVLSGKRAMTYEYVHRLSEFFNMPADVFFSHGESGYTALHASSTRPAP